MAMDDPFEAAIAALREELMADLIGLAEGTREVADELLDALDSKHRNDRDWMRWNLNAVLDAFRDNAGRCEHIQGFLHGLERAVEEAREIRVEQEVSEILALREPPPPPSPRPRPGRPTRRPRSRPRRWSPPRAGHP
jgi:hypothetical protein